VRLYKRLVLKIGEFSSLAQVSIRTLRHYDEVGLLKPMHVDAESSYRRYSVSQLPRLHRILALRDLGFPLDRIGEALEQGVSAEALRGMLLLRRVEQQKQVNDESERLNRLNALIHLIDKEGRMTSDVIVKDVEPQWIVSLRENIPAYQVVGQLIGKLYSLLGPLGGQGMGVGLLHDREYKEQDVDVEAGVYVKQLVEIELPLHCYQLPAVTVASVVHHGPFNRIGEAYTDLLRWVEANNYHACGPTRELFHHVNQLPNRDDSSNVTEIQVPLQKE
jgi:DNA-binding transcriptional MerR regulator/predicted transcriptional regulator YdeE